MHPGLLPVSHYARRFIYTHSLMYTLVVSVCVMYIRAQTFFFYSSALSSQIITLTCSLFLFSYRIRARLLPASLSLVAPDSKADNEKASFPLSISLSLLKCWYVRGILGVGAYNALLRAVYSHFMRFCIIISRAHFLSKQWVMISSYSFVKKLRF